MRRMIWLSLLASVVFTAHAHAQDLPAGTTACEMGGYSIDMDPKGANVRAEPNRSARVLGKLAAPVKADPKTDEATPGDDLWRTEFRIIGHRDGWFLIEKAQHPFESSEYAAERGRRLPKTVKIYRGRGWVAAGLVGGQYSNGANLPTGALYAEPNADSARLPAMGKLGGPISVDGGPRRVLACQGDWVKVESHNGVTGWWNSLCSSQVTNCS